jgi:14-3-3 protein epsilon
MATTSMGVPLVPVPENLDPRQALIMAKLAESAERYDEMTKYMNRCVKDKSGDDLTVEERNLISVGYKNLMSSRRTAQRVTQQQIDTPNLLKNIVDDASLEDPLKTRAEEYKETIAGELKALIEEVVEEVVKKFVEGPLKANNTEVLVFFHKMEGDYNRYGAEVTTGAEKAAFTKKAETAYATATELCEKQVPLGTGKAKEKGEAVVPSSETEDELPPTNPIRLGLALNYSVFMYEILEKRDEASKVADQAFEAAIDKLDELSEEQYRDSTLIMQLLKDNRDLWSTGDQDDYEDN